MPIYEYRCRDGHTTEVYRSVDARHLPAECEQCGAPAAKVISRVGYAMPDIAGYQSPITREWIGSRSAHRSHMRQHGVIEVGNEPIRPRKRTPLPPVRDDIIRAMETTR